MKIKKKKNLWSNSESSINGREGCGGGMLIKEIEKKYRTRISHSDYRKLQICEYLISQNDNWNLK